MIDEDNSTFAAWTYDSQRKVISSQHAGGAERIDIAYAGDGTASVAHAGGQTENFAFELVGRIRKPASIAGGEVDRSIEYDSNGYPKSVVDARGVATSMVYDSRGLETSRTEAYGTPNARTKSTQWHSTFRLPTQIEDSQARTTFSYNSNGLLLSRTVQDLASLESRTWSYTHDTFGRVITENGPRADVADVTTYTYYTCGTGAQCGRVYTIANALGHVTTFNSYNAHGQATRITDANGLVTTSAYDARQRLTDLCVGGLLPSCSGGELTHLDYWTTGLLKRVTGPDGSYLQYGYDAAHRLTQINDGTGNKVVYTLDAAGNQTSENVYDSGNALRRTHSRIYNPLNQLLKDVNAAGTAAVTTTFGYDDAGNQISIAAPLARNSANLYDELNRLVQITDPASGVTQFGYDANDNLTSVTDTRTLGTSYSYSGFGDLVTQTSPDTGLISNTYDSAGNLVTSTDARGVVSEYAYDVADRMSSASFTLGGVTDQVIAYAYDTGANQKGRLTSASDSNHSIAWSYDARGRVISKSQTVSGTTLSQAYGYNAQGRLTSTTFPSGAIIGFGYNSNGRVTSVTLNGSITILSNVNYDPFGPITGWTWGNSTTSSRAFDTDGKITQVDNAEGASLKDYTYDNASRIIGITDAADGALSWIYGYDSLDRLTSAQNIGLLQGWSYDANGNRLAETGTAPSTYVLSTTSNRIDSISGSLPRTYTYDASGNTLSYAGATFTYNNRGRMVTASNGVTTATYLYNALGQRVKRNVGGISTLFAYDESEHLTGEYTSAGALIQETVWLGDTPVATLRPNGSGGVNVFYVHSDHLNSPRLVSDTSNNIRWRWDSDPFGMTPPNQNPSGLGLFEYSLRFPGQQYDGIAGINYNYFRDYDPAVARYSQSDPIGLEGGTNTYAYVLNSPTASIDPLGLVPGPHTGPKGPFGPPDLAPDVPPLSVAG